MKSDDYDLREQIEPTVPLSMDYAAELDDYDPRESAAPLPIDYATELDDYDPRDFSESVSPTGEIANNNERIVLRNPTESHGIKKLIKQSVKKAAVAPFTIVKDGAKTAVTKLNPLDQKVNKESVTDHGMESMRLGYGTIKKGYQGIKTITRTIKTTARTIKTAKDVAYGAEKVVYQTGKGVYSVAKNTVKVTVFVGKVIGTAAVHIVAAATSPVFLLIVALIIIFVMFAALIILLLGGASTASTNTKAYSGAAGLGDVPAQYQNALNYFNTAVQNRQNGYNAMFDGMYYDASDLGHSNLVYMERTKADDTITIFEKSFSSVEYRDTLMRAWEVGVTASEAIAIAYVYLEKQQNESNGTVDKIYEVTYTQDVFDTIVANCIIYNDTVYAGQQCPESVCSRHVIQDPNPDYETALATNNLAAEAYNDWVGVAEKIYYHNHMIWDGASQIAYWNNIVIPAINEWIIKYNRDDIDTENDGDLMLQKLGMEYLEAASVLQNTPPTIETIVYNCDLQHDLHSIGLYFYDKEDVMNALSFTDAEKQWVELTEIGFENNPDIP